MKPFRDIAAAFGWLSVVPVAPHADARPARWFPLVGWLFGGVAAGIAWLAWRAGVGPLGSLLVGAVIVGAWAALSRFLHWDGVADTADGLLGGHTPERRREIMHDSRTGAFGAGAIALGMLLQTLAIGTLVSAHSLWPLLAAPVLGRLACSAGLWTLTPARTSGLAAHLSASEGVLPWIFVAACLAPLVVGFDPMRGSVLFVGVIAAILVPRVLARPIGGVSGDVLGASVVIVETLVLLVPALMTGV